MFYAYDLFVKKGKLGKLWIAGTVFHKLSKAQIVNCDIKMMCGDIKNPALPLALPTQSTLLRGVCRIERKLAQYLLDDAVDIKQKLRLVEVSAVDLPEKHKKARADQITIDERKLMEPLVIEDFTITIPEYSVGGPEDALLLSLSFQADTYRQAHQALPEEITMSEGGVDLMLQSADALGPTHYRSESDLDLIGDVLPEDTTDQHGKESTPSFTPLGPIEEGQAQVPEKEEEEKGKEEVKKKKKPVPRKIKDFVCELSDDVIRAQLTDYADIQTTRPAKRTKHGTWERAKGDVHAQPSITFPHISQDLKSAFLKRRRLFPEPSSTTVTPDKRQRQEYGDMGEEMAYASDAAVTTDREYSDIERARTQFGGRMSSDDESVASKNSFLGFALDEDAVTQKRDRDRSSLGLGAGLNLSRLSESDQDAPKSGVKRRLTGLHEVGDEREERTKKDRQQRKEKEGQGLLGVPLSEEGSGPTPVTPMHGVRPLSHTPIDADLPFSQFELALEEVSYSEEREEQRHREEMDRRHLTPITKIFIQLLNHAFNTTTPSKSGKHAVTLEEVMNIALTKSTGDIGSHIILARDAALAFMQVLILKTLGFVDVRQDVQYSHIEISKTAHWDTEL